MVKSQALLSALKRIWTCQFHVLKPDPARMLMGNRNYNLEKMDTSLSSILLTRTQNTFELEFPLPQLSSTGRMNFNTKINKPPIVL